MTPWTVARQVPLSMEFSRQEYWSELPFPPPGNLPNSGIKPVFLASLALAGEFFSTAPPENLRNVMTAHLLPESGSGLAGRVDPDL